MKSDRYSVRHSRDESGAGYDVHPAVLHTQNLTLAQDRAEELWKRGQGGYVERVSDGARRYPSEAKWISSRGEEVPA